MKYIQRMQWCQKMNHLYILINVEYKMTLDFDVNFSINSKFSFHIYNLIQDRWADEGERED